MLIRFRNALAAKPRRGTASVLFSLVPWVLLGAVWTQALEPVDPALRVAVSSSSAAPSPPAGAIPNAAPGPTVSDLRAAFSGHPLRQVDPETFQRYAALHAGQGHLLVGSELAAVVAAASAQPETRSALRQDEFDRDSLLRPGARGPAPAPLIRTDSTPHAAPASSASAHSPFLDSSLARDSIASLGDTVPKALPQTFAEPDETSGTEEEAKSWFGNLFVDLSDGGHGGHWGGGDWAAVIYVLVGVVVVGAFLLYGVQTLYNLAANQEDDPLFMEAGLRISYSGKALAGPSGTSDLYRDTYLAGLRFAIGLDKPGMGMGLTVEGGYIDVRLRGISDPERTFNFEGGYLVAGPLIRFGHNDPFSFNLEFLNGTSNHASIGWISKSRMALEAKVSPHTLIGAHLGAVFYDLHFLDGLGWRSGSFNRDLSLVYGLDAGWAF